MGTLVKRLTTSKLTMVLLLWIVVRLIWFAKSVEFLMKELVLPVRGERIYAVTPKQVPYQEIIMATEATARQLDAESAKTLRIGVSDALRTARPPPSNLDKGMKKALKNLRKDEDYRLTKEMQQS